VRSRKRWRTEQSWPAATESERPANPSQGLRPRIVGHPPLPSGSFFGVINDEVHAGKFEPNCGLCRVLQFLGGDARAARPLDRTDHSL
jgi:hypothetical protein